MVRVVVGAKIVGMGCYILYSGCGDDILQSGGCTIVPHCYNSASCLSQQRGVNTVAALGETMWILTIGHLEIHGFATTTL